MYLMFAAIGMAVTVAAQTPLSNNQLNAAAADGKNPAELASFIDYYNSKANLQPAQRNADPISTQAMANPGFETGDFTGWTGYIGDNSVSSFGPLQNVVAGIYSTAPNTYLSDANARHTIMTSAWGPDVWGGFDVVPPGMGTYTARLGGTTPNYQGEIMEQTFTVDPGSPYIRVSYAVVLDEGPHTISSNSYFRYEVLDNAGNPIATRAIYTNDTALSLYPPDTTVKFLPWVSDSISLSAYIGTNITLRYTVAGCTDSGHWGYCYTDAETYQLPPSLSIAENQSSSFSIYPNPANDFFEINGNVNSDNGTIQLIDCLGQNVDVNVTATANGWKINMSDKAPGIYFVEVISGAEKTVQRLVKQ